MKISLVWRGPAGAGSFPADPAALEAMFQPGVYLRIKRYARGRVVSYVGQSKSILARIDQHLTQLLAFQHTLRDPEGEVWMRGDFPGRLQCYRDIAAAAALAAEDASRMRFFWAHCDETFHVEHLGIVEAALKDRLEASAAAENGLCLTENQQVIPFGAFDEPVHIENDYVGLDAHDHALLARLLGDAPIVFDRDPAEIFHG